MSVAIVVPSFDGYSDLWPIAATLFERYWPDRPWPIYWLTNGHPVPSIARPILRPTIQRRDWGWNLASAVESVSEDFILLWIEEVLLLSPVPHDLMLEAADLMACHSDVGIVQLTHYYHRPTPSMATIGRFMDCPAGVPGFSAAMPALFRKDILLYLLRTTRRSNRFEKDSFRIMARDFPTVRSLIACHPMFTFCDNPLLAHGGVWCQCAVEHMRAEGFEIDFTQRGLSPNPCRFMDGTPA